MSNFSEFKEAVNHQLTIMEGHGLFFTDTDKDELWDTYLDSFPEGSNPMYKERTEHDANVASNLSGRVVQLYLSLIVKLSLYGISISVEIIR